jgi:hypothetical protein
LPDFIEVESAGAAFAFGVEADAAVFSGVGFEDVDFAAFAGAVSLEEHAEAGVAGVVEFEGEFLEVRDVFLAAVEAPREEAFFPHDVDDFLE